MNTITPKELHEKMKNEDVLLIDVRSSVEYKGEHAKGAQNIPVDTIKGAAQELKKKVEVYVCCGGGSRSGRACNILRNEGVNVIDVKGGLSEWKKQGLEIESTGKVVISVMRQFLIIAGTLILLGVLLGWYVNPYWYLMSFAVGAGQVFAGSTGICFMTSMIEKLPWNKG
jgi:rhodanese-related sulfurtransferase